MSTAENIQKIIQIEQQYEVNSVTYQGLKVWPIIRLNLVQLLSTPAKNNSKKTASNRVNLEQKVENFRFSEIQTEYLNQAKLWQEKLTPFWDFSKTDILFFSRWENHSEKVNGRFYDRCLDPILEQCKTRTNNLKIELDSPQSRQKQPRWEPSIYIDPTPCLIKEHLIRCCLSRTLKQHRIQNFAELQFIIHQNTDFWLDEQQLLNQIYLLQSYQTFFTDLLSIIRPKVVFLVCYYYIVAMALVKVCRELGIKTVEVQHGIQGKLHSLYAHWSKIPQSGYDFLPDYFWVWSEQCQRDMMETRPPFGGNQTHHIPLVGGNLWLAKWSKEDFGLSEAEKAFLNQLRQYQKVILVSLQTFDMLPELLDLLVPAMQEGAGSWFWLIRFHPLHQGEREVKRVLSALQPHGLTNFEIEFSTKTPLYSLLRHCDYHVTVHSTVCHEAYALGVKTGILDPLKKGGYFYHKEQIENGNFDLITQHENMVSAINSSTRNFGVNTDGEGYIDIRTEFAERILSHILRQPNPSF